MDIENMESDAIVKRLEALSERDRITVAEAREMQALTHEIGKRQPHRRFHDSGAVDDPSRGYSSGDTQRSYVSGNEMELRSNQSWFDYAATRGALDSKRLPRELRNARTIEQRMQHYEAFFGEQLQGMGGFSKRGAEFRTVYGLEEDVTSGGGSASSLVATILSHDVIDLIRAKTFLFKAGAVTVPMPSEYFNLPTWEADVAPVYLSEATAASLDVTPQAGVLKFAASNAWVDDTAASIQIMMDAFNSGGVAALITHSISEKWARKMEALAVYGDASAVTNQAPGWVAESILTQSMGTNGATPTSYKDISKAAAQVRAQNVEPTAILSHPSVMAEYAQLVDTLGQPMRRTPDLENLPWFDSGTLHGYTETQGTSNVASSIYVGDFSYVKVGVRTDPPVQIMRLQERYADQLLVAWVSYFRGAFRVARATQTICALQGILA